MIWILIIAIVIIIIIALLADDSNNNTTTVKSSPANYYQPERKIPAAPAPTPTPTILKAVNQPENRLKPLYSEEDIKYSMTTVERENISQAKKAMEQTSINLRRKLNLDFDFNEIDELLNLANNLVNNSSHAKNINSRYEYYTNLWFRSVKASSLVEKAEALIQSKLDYLHKLDFDKIPDKSERAQIIELQKKLPNLIQVVRSYKISLYNNNHKLKYAIRDSGPKGREWFKRLQERINEKQAAAKSA